MLGDRNFIAILVIGPDEEKKPSEEQREESSGIGKHIVKLIMSSFDLKNGSSLLNLHPDVMSRIKVDSVSVVAY